jgi:hypothetical protein
MRQLHEHKRSKHRFITGNVVRLSKRYPPRKAAPGPYNVVAQLPERDGQLQYRIKSGFEPFYRTVAENELEADVAPGTVAAS